MLLAVGAVATTSWVLRRQSLEGFPPAAVAAARQGLREAEASAPGSASLDEARRRAAELERAVATASTAPWPPRHFAAVDTAAAELRATLAAVSAQRAAERDRLAVDAAALLDEAAALLEEPREALPRFPADRPLRIAVGRARLELERGRAALAAADPAAAGDAARRALDAAREAGEHLAAHTQRLERPDLQRQWDLWVRAAVEESRKAPSILVDKASGRTYLLAGGRVKAAYASEIGRGGLAPKRHAGDAATPEGRYRVAERRDRGATRYHRALLLDYPNGEDRRRYADNRRAGRIPAGRGIGSLIEIHGDGGRGVNWTDGCVALANPDMDHLFAAVRVGTPVTIVGRVGLPLGTALSEVTR